ncbi:6035_t:CDS:2, partial [Ambispora leptoticha]
MYCKICLQKLNAEIWKCPVCDFPSWTSGDKKIDEYLIEAQRNLNKAEWPIWIPFNRFRDIELIAVGGFGKVSKAIWEKRNEDPDILTVALKEVFDSRNYNLDLINEIEMNLISHKYNLMIYGITRNPKSNNFILVQKFFYNGALNSIIKNADLSLK